MGRVLSLLLSSSVALLVAQIADAAAGTGCPNHAKGVLAMHNTLRADHNSTGRVKRLKWDASLAAKAQAHANGCKWGHSTGAALAGNGESIMSQPVAFPVRGLDVCSYAAWALYQEVSNYNFNAPGTSWETDMPVGHLINLLWAETTRLGCGFTACPSLGSYVVCWYGPGFYKTPDYHSAMGANVPRSRCQLATKDDWCERCSGSTCTRCFERPNYGQRMARFPIRYDKTRKRCVSACPTSMGRCALCSASRTCLACKPGWGFDKGKQCVVKVPAAGHGATRQ